MAEDTESPYLSGRRDAIAAAALMAVCGVALWSLVTNPYIDPVYYAPDPGPGFLPVLIIAALAFASLLLGASGLLRMRAAGTDGGDRPPLVSAVAARELALPAAMVASLGLVFAALPLTGFVAAGIPFAVLWCGLIAWQDGRRIDARAIARFAGEAVLIVLIVHTVFVRLIGVPLS